MSRLILAALLYSPPAAAQNPESPSAEPADVDVARPTLAQPLAPLWPAGAAHRDPFSVEVTVHVEPDGHATAVIVPESLPLAFAREARDALLRLTYVPVIVQGEPMAGDAVVTVRFDPDAEVIEELIVESARRHPQPDLGAGDVRIDVRAVQAVPTLNATDALELAPSVFLTRTGNDTHPEQIFLRGFDARHGQDVQVTLDGVPLNQVGNPHGHGLVDLHVVPAEAMAHVRVLQGPFDPAQGDFAVAGSLEISPGLGDPGLWIRGQGGSFGTGRAVVGWQHAVSAGTFAVAEVMRTAGYGENRDAQRASTLLRREGDGWFISGGAYASAYGLAGVVRQVDVDAGRIDLFGTQDPNQGGSFGQAFLAGGLEGEDGPVAWRLRASVAQRHQRLRMNFTGFLTDDRRPGESPHPQRGDLTDQAFGGTTATVDADAVHQAHDLPGGAEGALRVGFFGRYDDVEGHFWRLRASNGAPYRVEADYGLRQVNVAAYAGGELTLGRVTGRAGARAETLVYDLLDRCAAKDVWFPGAERDDVNCPDEDRIGQRLRAGARTARGFAVLPRGSITVRVGREHAWTSAGGMGARSIEALALSQDEDSPFGRLWGAETGWLWRRAAVDYTALHSLVAYTTQVDRDLVFDEGEVRNVVAGETARYGASAVSEVSVGPFTERATVTYTYAVFGDELAPSYSAFATDRQAGRLVPYVPPWVARLDLILGGAIGGLDALRGGLGLDFIAPRPLPQSEFSRAVFTLDGSLAANEGPWELAVTVTNLLNARYPLAEYNFASWFPESSGSAFPTRVVSRQIAPGAPRALLVGLTLRPGGA